VGELGCDPHFFPVAAKERFSQDLFAFAEVVGRSSIKIIDTGIDRVPDLLYCPLFIDASLLCGKTHAAEAKDEEPVAGFWNGTVEHRNTSFIRKLTGQSVRGTGILFNLCETPSFTLEYIKNVCKIVRLGMAEIGPITFFYLPKHVQNELFIISFSASYSRSGGHYFHQQENPSGPWIGPQNATRERFNLSDLQNTANLRVF
jgi:hypothetical protein